MALSFEQWSRCLGIFIRASGQVFLRLTIWRLCLSAKLKVADDSRGAREAHYGESLGVWRCRFPYRSELYRICLNLYNCVHGQGLFPGVASDAPSDTMGTGNAIRACAQHYSLGVIASGIALPIAGRLPLILLSTFLSSRIRSSTGG
jgi:hypothetical protein